MISFLTDNVLTDFRDGAVEACLNYLISLFILNNCIVNLCSLI